MTEWVILFDYRDHLAELAALPACGVAAAVAIALTLKFRSPANVEVLPAIRRERLSLKIALPFVLVWAVFGSVMGVARYKALIQADRRGAFISTTGPASQFHAMPKSGVFTVNGVAFRYPTCCVMDAAYKGRLSRDNRLEPGQMVSIDSLNGQIIRIWRME